MRFVIVAPQVIVAAGCAGLAVFYFENAFAFGDAGVEPPVEWRIVFGAVMGVIVVTGFGLGFAYGRFPWLVPLMIPPMTRAFMLRPFQQDLYSLALLLGVYADVLFLVGAAAQLDSAQLRVKFGAPLDREIFHVPPGFDLVVDYGVGHQVCTLQVPAVMPTDAKVQNTDEMRQKMHGFLAELVPDSMRGKEMGRGQGISGPFNTVSTVMYEQVTITEVASSNTITVQFKNTACQQPAAH